MKSAIIALCFAACVYASAVDKDATVVRESYDQNPDGSYGYGYETSNGISGQASASVKQLGKEEVALEVSGSDKYVNPDGTVIETTYVANEFGYQPRGAHLPTPPAPEPIPEYIQKALIYIKEHPYVEKKE